MRLVKKLLVLVAAMTIVLTLVACGGEKFPQVYSYTEPRGQGEQVATLTLEEDGTYKYVFAATASNGSGEKVMEVTMTGTYTKDGDTVTCDTVEEGKGYYTAGTSRTDFTFDKENVGMYANTYAKGCFEFLLDGDLFAPVME